MTADAVRACGLCRDRRYRHWWRVEGYDIGRCLTCGLVQVLQDVSDEELTRLYGQGYYEGESNQVYQDYLADGASKREAFGARFDRIVSELGLVPGTCLEVGCAFGLFLVEAQLRGWTVRGIERSAHSATWARTQLGLAVDTAPDAIYKVPSSSQDFVAMWDVIEHLKEPLDLLLEVRRILKPKGILALSTGNVGSLSARLYGKRWYLIAPPYHTFYFDRASIRRALQTAGFTVCAIRSEGHPLANGSRWKIPRWYTRYIGWRVDRGPIMEVMATTATHRA